MGARCRTWAAATRRGTARRLKPLTRPWGVQGRPRCASGRSGATGTGAYIAVASRLVNERARPELKRRGDAWRAAGLGSFATVKAVATRVGLPLDRVLTAAAKR